MTLLYEGRQIYFGHINTAKQYFVDMGYHCPDRQTTADFLTSLTNPAERTVRQGFEAKVPRTPDEFAEAWRNSQDRAQLVREIEDFNQRHPLQDEVAAKFYEARKAQKASLV